MTPYAFAIAALAMAIPLPYVLQHALWASSDLGGQVGTIELFRQGIAAGTLWPIDWSQAAGHDGIGYYGWYIQILFGLCAQGLHLLGVSNPALVVAQAGCMAFLGGVVLLAAWWGRRFATPGLGERGEICGALAGIGWLAILSDGHAAQGAGIVLDIGLLTSGLGMLLFLAIVARWRIVADRGVVGLDPILAVLVALVIGTHTISALCAAVVLALAIVAGDAAQRRAILISGIVGTLLAAPAVHAVAVTLREHNPQPDLQNVVGDDVISATLKTMPLGVGILVGLVLLPPIVAGLVDGWRRNRTLWWAVVALLVLGAFPLGGELLPVSVHRYRLLPPAGLLLVLAGLPWCAEACGWLLQRCRVELVALIGTVMAFALVVQASTSLRSGYEPEKMSDYQRSLAAMRTGIPAGARVVMSNQEVHVDLAPNRTLIHAAAPQLGFETLNSFHWLVASIPSTPAAIAAETFGVRPWINTVQPVDDDQATALAILRDLGVTHLMAPAPAATLPPRVIPTLEPIPTWPQQRVGRYDMWTVPDPRPRIEAIAGDVVALRRVPGGWMRHWYAEWWSRTRVRSHSASRIIVAEHGTPPGAVQLDVPEDAPRSPGPQVLISYTVRQLYAAMNGVRTAISAPAPPLPLDLPQPQLDRQGQSLVLDHLVPGRAYLVRYAWSAGMRWDGGSAYDELGGFTVVLPQKAHMVGAFARVRTDGLWMGWVIAAVVGLGMVGWAARRRVAHR